MIFYRKVNKPIKWNPKNLSKKYPGFHFWIGLDKILAKISLNSVRNLSQNFTFYFLDWIGQYFWIGLPNPNPNFFTNMGFIGLSTIHGFLSIFTPLLKKTLVLARFLIQFRTNTYNPFNWPQKKHVVVTKVAWENRNLLLFYDDYINHV